MNCVLQGCVRMNPSNPYEAPETSPRMPARIRLRDQQLLRQSLLFSMFYFAGFGCLLSVVAGINRVPQYFAGVVEDFADIWLLELMFALVPYVVLRALTIGRLVRPSWWSFCVAGFAAFPFLHVYSNLLLRYWDTPSVYNIVAHLLSVGSAILMELLAITLFGMLQGRSRTAEPNAERADWQGLVDERV